MRIYIWERVTHLTDNWHSEGGLVVVAESIDDAREMLRRREDVPAGCEAFDEPPDRTYTLAADEVAKEVVIFPDAGCC